MYINKFDNKAECALTGEKAEELFELFLKKSGKKYRRATLAEQYEHVDFIVTTPKREITVDVKATKKAQRSNTTFNNDIIWVEFKNVRGDKGWLYGKNELIAFYREIDTSFYVVRTTELAELCERICDNKRVFYPNEALYHKYTRMGRKDSISMIQFSDLLKIPYNRIIIKRG